MSSGSISQRVRTGGADPSSDAGGDEGLLQRIIDAIPAPVFFKDAECRYIGCNEAFARGVMGSAPADIAGKGVHDIAPAELARVYEAADRALLAEGGSQMYETQVRFTDGGYRDIAFHKAVFPDLSGNPGGIVGVMLDITERKRHEARLAEREQMFRSVFDASEDAMLIYDEGRLVDCNPATVRMLRCPSREWVINREPAALSPTHQPDGRASREKAAEMVRTAFERHFHRFEWVHRRADGEAFPCEVTLTTMTLGGRKVLHVVWNDITERRRRERQIEALANYDPLTGLANRRLLRSRGHALLARARREGGRWA
ncbi:MAG: PAS domain S-box protein [Arhodomonas sp.]|nr:PAS domain S-box protein [Arhodomonas sp.]